MMKIHNDLNDIFIGISCFTGTFKLQVREGSCPYQVPHIQVVYALHGLPREELERFKKQQIIVPIDADEMSEWCNSFVLISKENGKVMLCL